MIELFEEYTHDLTDYEQEFVLPFLLELLPMAKGKDNIIINTEIVERLHKFGLKSSPPRIRHILHCIRVSGMIPCLMATSKGYYVSDSVEELTKYVNSLEDRIKHISNVRYAIKVQLDDLKRKKMRIFSPEIMFR